MRNHIIKAAIVCGLTLVALAACEREAKRAVKPAEPDSFQRGIMTGELVPVANGGAYLLASSAIYYVIGNVAMPVEGLPSELLLGELVPLADGAAILRIPMTQSRGLFRLEGSKATSISKGFQAANTMTSPAPGHLFAQNQYLRQKLKRAEDRSSSPDNHEVDEPRERY